MEKPKIAAKKSLYLEMEPGDYFWCTCGRSQKQPFCDGSHVGTGFTPMPVSFDKPQSVYWCQCKQSKNSPFCDGTHKEL